LDRDPRYAQRAALLFVLGDKDSAYALLERAVDTRDVDALVVVPAIPELYPFHGEPRYQRLRERMGLKK
jgi:hypothetical protein